jgi:hypothetical protein
VSDAAPTSLSLLSLLLSPHLGEQFPETGGWEVGVAELGQHVAEVGPRVDAQPVAVKKPFPAEQVAAIYKWLHTTP